LNLTSPDHHFFHAAVIVHYDEWNICSKLGFATNKVNNLDDYRQERLRNPKIGTHNLCGNRCLTAQHF